MSTVRTGRTAPTDRRTLARAGLVAPIAFVVGVVLAAWAWPDYRHATQNISDLGGTHAPVPVIQNVTFVVFGLLVGAFAWGLRRPGRQPDASGAAALLVGWFGISMILLGLTPCSPGCADGTPADVVHSLAALTGFLAMAAAMIVTWRRSRSAPGSSRYAVFSMASGLVVLLVLVGWIAASAVAPEALYAGTLQRVLVGAVLLWLVATGIRVGAPR